MDVFDPWTATIEQATAQPDAYKSPGGALHQAAIAHELTAHKDRIINGFDVLHCVALCAEAGLAMPDWLSAVFLKRFRKVQQCQVSSWDEAFDKPYPAGAQIAAKRRQRKSRVTVVNAVRAAIASNPTASIDTYFWEQIGTAIGEGNSLG